MFGHRPDGKVVKNLPGLFKIIPMIMPQRNDAQVLFDYDIRIAICLFIHIVIYASFPLLAVSDVQA